MKKQKNFLLFCILLLAALLFASCEKSPTEIIDQPLVKFIVRGISAPETFTLSEQDSSFVASLKVENTKTVSEIWFDISSADGLTSIASNVKMKDNGNSLDGDETENDGIFSGKTFIGRQLKSGEYQITFFIEDMINSPPANIHKVGVKYFTIVGGKANSTPVLSNLVMPDTVSIGQKFTFSVKVEDEDGLQDIREVYYELFNPNGEKVVNSKGISQFPLFDDGDTSSNGDETAGDGVYTVFLTIPSGQPTGLWEFKFTAVDKSNAKSNQLSKKVFVK